MNVQLKSYRWFTHNGVSVCGYCYDQAGRLLREEQLCAYFGSAHSADALAELLRKANGLFAVVIREKNQLFAAVDRVRRFPLFYTQSGELTDTPQSLDVPLEWDEAGKAFYLSSGAVLPGHTLVKAIQQLPPASTGVYTSEGWQVKPYATYLCRENEEKDCSLQMLDTIMTATFRRMIASVDERQIVVPLTAGNDSRLILCMLHRLGYKNVVCYTVEGKDGHEWNGAHEAAEHLGYAHYRVDVSDEKVQQLCYSDSEVFEKYYRYAGCFTNFCWLYDYVAVQYMQKQGLIAADAVFVPGHSGDMLAGSHLGKARVGQSTPLRGLVRRMLYVGFEYELQDGVRQIMTDYFHANQSAGNTGYSAYQNWVVQHRQAHNIVNSTRVYDYFGYEVRLPLWDSELYELFAHLPYNALAGNRLYTDYLKSVFGQFALPVAMPSAGVSWFAQACKKSIKKHLPARLLRHTGKHYDPIGEEVLSRPLGDELSRWLGHPHTCTNSNQLLLQWYLMRVSQGRG